MPSRLDRRALDDAMKHFGIDPDEGRAVPDVFAGPSSGQRLECLRFARPVFPPRPWDVRWGRWVTCRGCLGRRYRRAGLVCLFGAAVTSVGPTTPAMSPSGRPGVVGVVVRWARLVLGVLRQDNMGAVVSSGARGLPAPSGRRTRARLGARCWGAVGVPGTASARLKEEVPGGSM